MLLLSCLSIISPFFYAHICALQKWQRSIRRNLCEETKKKKNIYHFTKVTAHSQNYNIFGDKVHYSIHFDNALT